MKKLLLFLLVFAATFIACRKDNVEPDNSAAQDNSEAENIFSDIYKVVDDVSENTTGIRDLTTPCIDTIIVDTTTTPRVVMIDFGTDECSGIDGRVRKGRILVTYTGRYRDAGTIITITPQNYTVDGYLIVGAKTIVNEGTNSNGQPYFTIVVTATITAPNAAYVTTWNSTRTRTWTQGYNTITPLDDVYQITGLATGTNRNGISYAAQVTEPLVAKVTCPWLVSGEYTVNPANGATRTVNFGSGDCNNGFTVTVNGNTYSFNGGN
jgi:hypothetical protein